MLEHKCSVCETTTRLPGLLMAFNGQVALRSDTIFTFKGVACYDCRKAISNAIDDTMEELHANAREIRDQQKEDHSKCPVCKKTIEWKYLITKYLAQSDMFQTLCHHCNAVIGITSRGTSIPGDEKRTPPPTKETWRNVVLPKHIGTKPFDPTQPP